MFKVPDPPPLPAGFTYAVGDVHGRLDLLRAALDAISDHGRGRRSRLVFLGDYVDRGPDSRGVVDLLMHLQQHAGAICLKGNHEQLMVQAVTAPEPGLLERWLEFGGEQTLRSYGLAPGDPLGEAIPRAHIGWMSGLPLTTADPHRIFVHAGLAPRTAVHRQKEQSCLWIRDAFLRARPRDFEAHVVHGHTPIWEGKPDAAEPELLEHRTNLDTGAFATGTLYVGVFDSEVPGGPVEMLKIQGKPMPELWPSYGGGLASENRDERWDDVRRAASV